MRGQYFDTGYGEDRFIPYYESDDEAYERMMLGDEEHEMSPQMLEALRVYVNLVEEYESFDRADCSCDIDNFHQCSNCHESAEALTAMRRHFNNWGERFAWELAKREGLLPKPEHEEAQS